MNLSRDPQYQQAVLLCRPILLATVAYRGKTPKIPMLIHIIVIIKIKQPNFKSTYKSKESNEHNKKSTLTG